MSKEQVIHIDFSTLAAFRQCEEKGRLSFVEHLQPIIERPALSFGSSFHAGIAEFYKSIGQYNNAAAPNRENAKAKARLAFIKELRKLNSALPISMESDEKRSVERGLNLLDAYFEKWKNEPYVNYLRPDTQAPYVEIGFAIYFMEWRGIPVVYVGRIDRIMRSRTDGNLYNKETKTTSQGLSSFIKQVRPNHQVTGYHWAAKELLGLTVSGTIWDCIFVSDRKPKADGNQWEQSGIDMDKDFARQDTRRTPIDIEEFLYDLEMTTTRFLTLKESGLRRWERAAPTACHTYGGCQFLDVCSSNLNPNIIKTKFKVEEWKPWEGITTEEKLC